MSAHVIVWNLETVPDLQGFALKMYTWNSAWLSFEENERGSLERGKLVDLAVLDRDYLTVPVDDILSIQSQLTMVWGKVVYAAGPSPPTSNIRQLATEHTPSPCPSFEAEARRC